MNIEHLVLGGERVPAADRKTFSVIEPGLGEPFAEVAEAGSEDIRRAVQVAYTAFEEGKWPRLSATERGRVLLKVSTLLRERLEDIAIIEARNAGKPIADARAEVGLAAAVFEYWGGAANKLCGETIPVQDAGLAISLREPVGVCGLITPWNFPLVIASWKIAPCLACGNTAVVKPAQLTPLDTSSGRYFAGGRPACWSALSPARARLGHRQRAGHLSPGVKGLVYRLKRGRFSDHAFVRRQYHPGLTRARRQSREHRLR